MSMRCHRLALPFDQETAPFTMSKLPALKSSHRSLLGSTTVAVVAIAFVVVRVVVVAIMEVNAGQFRKISNLPSDLGRQESKEASRQAGQQASKHASRQASKQASSQPSKQAAKQAANQGSCQASKQPCPLTLVHQINNHSGKVVRPLSLRQARGSVRSKVCDGLAVAEYLRHSAERAQVNSASQNRRYGSRAGFYTRPHLDPFLQYIPHYVLVEGCTIHTLPLALCVSFIVDAECEIWCLKFQFVDELPSRPHVLLCS